MAGDAPEIGRALQVYPPGRGFGGMTNVFALILRVLVVAVVIWLEGQFMFVFIVPFAVALVIGLVIGGLVLSAAAAVVTILVAASLVLAVSVAMVALSRRREAPTAV